MLHTEIRHNSTLVLDDLVDDQRIAGHVLYDALARRRVLPRAPHRPRELCWSAIVISQPHALVAWPKVALLGQRQGGGVDDVLADPEVEVTKEMEVKRAELGAVADDRLVVSPELAVRVAPCPHLPVLKAALIEVLLRLGSGSGHGPPRGWG
eukprot:5779654-Prymnesium_polylepis.1